MTPDNPFDLFALIILLSIFTMSILMRKIWIEIDEDESRGP